MYSDNRVGRNEVKPGSVKQAYLAGPGPFQCPQRRGEHDSDKIMVMELGGGSFRVCLGHSRKKRALQKITLPFITVSIHYCQSPNWKPGLSTLRQ